MFSALAMKPQKPQPWQEEKRFTFDFLVLSGAPTGRVVGAPGPAFCLSMAAAQDAMRPSAAGGILVTLTGLSQATKCLRRAPGKESSGSNFEASAFALFLRHDCVIMNSRSQCPFDARNPAFGAAAKGGRGPVLRAVVACS
jgi:hypothetical protein